MPSMTCPECHSPNVIPDVEVVDRSHYTESSLSVKVLAEPNAMIFTGRVNSDLRARVCGNCGHTTFHAVDYKDLWQAHQKAEGIPQTPSGAANDRLNPAEPPVQPGKD
jgi:hypothetical protein